MAIELGQKSHKFDWKEICDNSAALIPMNARVEYTKQKPFGSEVLFLAAAAAPNAGDPETDKLPYKDGTTRMYKTIVVPQGQKLYARLRVKLTKNQIEVEC
jgi:hypothetical protein